MAATLSDKQRSEYLKALDQLGGEAAHIEGIKLLKAVDSGKSAPKPPPLPAGQEAHMNAMATKLKVPKGNIKKKLFCSLKCAPHALTQDWAGLAACIFQCMVGS